MFNGVESGVCLLWINFLWQVDLKVVHSWNIQGQFSLEKKNKIKMLPEYPESILIQLKLNEQNDKGHHEKLYFREIHNQVSGAYEQP